MGLILEFQFLSVSLGVCAVDTKQGRVRHPEHFLQCQIRLKYWQRDTYVHLFTIYLKGGETFSLKRRRKDLFKVRAITADRASRIKGDFFTRWNRKRSGRHV